MPRAIIFTEGGTQLGMGHLYRCAAYAEELASSGWETAWRVCGDSLAQIFLSDRDSQLGAWHENEEATNKLEKFDLAIIDSYQASLNVYSRIADRVADCIYLDDWARLAYPKGYVVNCAPNAEKLPYILNKDTQLLLGSQYYALRKEFLEGFERAINPRIEKILIVMGATDLRNLSPEVLKIAHGNFPESEIRMVVSNELQREKLALLENHQQKILGNRTASEMRTLMEWADICISAAGQTLYELCRMGLPTIAIGVADNQRLNIEGFLEAEAILFAGWWDDKDLSQSLTGAFERIRLSSVRSGLMLKGQFLVGEGGCRRVLRAVFQKNVVIRKAVEADASLLWRWRNSPEVRANSFATEPIPWKDHLGWFLRNLISPNARIFVGQQSKGEAIGQVRFDLEDTGAVISISVDEAHRRRGLGEMLIRLGIKTFRQEFPTKPITALIKKENIASQSLFQRCGFQRVDTTEFNVSEYYRYQYER